MAQTTVFNLNSSEHLNVTAEVRSLNNLKLLIVYHIKTIKHKLKA